MRYQGGTSGGSQTERDRGYGGGGLMGGPLVSMEPPLGPYERYKSRFEYGLSKGMTPREVYQYQSPRESKDKSYSPNTLDKALGLAAQYGISQALGGIPGASLAMSMVPKDRDIYEQVAYGRPAQRAMGEYLEKMGYSQEEINEMRAPDPDYESDSEIDRILRMIDPEFSDYGNWKNTGLMGDGKRK